MKYQILRKETDMSGKIRVWVDVGNEEVQIFKFSEKPTKEIIKSEVDKFLTEQQNEII